MEKLRKALDRARDQRAGIGPSAPVAVEAPSPVVTSARPVASAAYRYERTRVYAPSAEVLEQNRIISGAAQDRPAEAFRMLRTQVLQRMQERGWRSLAVVSPTPDDGRSMVAANLAVAIAADPRYSALLVDLDLRAPSIAGLFDCQPVVGVDDVLARRASVEECLVHPASFDRLVLLPARAAVAGSSELLAGVEARALAQDLRDRYANRVVILDLPPMLVADDALAFARNVDAALVVVSEGHTRRDDVVRCLELLRPVPVVGTVLNRCDLGGPVTV